MHQDLGLIESMDVVDNLAFGTGYTTDRFGSIRWRAERRRAQASLARLGMTFDVSTLVGDLTISERTAVAIARALSAHRTDRHVLVLDEPTANLPAPEVERLFALLRRLSDDGLAILFISHHFDEIFHLADRASVLRDSRVVADTAVADVTEAQLVELMLGRPLELADHVASARTDGEVVIRATGLGGEVVSGVDLSVAAGEIVGVAGLTGSGREELAALITGGDIRSGSVEVCGVETRPGDPRRGMRLGIAAVPAERKVNALLHDHTVRENMTISDLTTFDRGGALRKKIETAEVEGWLESLDIRPRRPEADVATLSGGNQQKVVIARALRLRPKALVLDEPTQGVDVGAQAEIHRLLREAVQEGMGILACSSSSQELAEIADRVLVLRDGRIVAELLAPLDPDEISTECLRSRSEGNHGIDN